MATLALTRGRREKGTFGNVTELGEKKCTSSPAQARDCPQLPLPEKRGHSSTPSNSDDADKPPSEPVSSGSSTQTGPDAEQPSGGQAEGKGRCAGPQAESRSRKPREEEEEKEEEKKEEKEEKAEPPAPSLSRQAQESLRWEGALDDPVAEAERMEIYRANRRRRYLSTQQSAMPSTPTAPTTTRTRTTPRTPTTPTTPNTPTTPATPTTPTTPTALTTTRTRTTPAPPPLGQDRGHLIQGGKDKEGGV
ncbi:hypothetical protein AAFF_G00255890 [Aldrovandia affinis]|uniref:Uncharacterized protein n=1 Tax=Aldrovandia affinis TaxID=143900 RepID=A0AAD7W2Z6_9TELE|nr:hypothetical protein AAFF_G00255890 [Aldrovandia affinis]